MVWVFSQKGRIVESTSRSKGSLRSRSPRPRYDDERRSRSRSYESVYPARRTPNPRRSPSPRRTPPSRGGSPDGRNHKECSPTLKSVSLCGRPADSQSPSRHSNTDE
ncbi:serine/arginine repetitive matrix protein 1-like [Camellia sinensis]|uniref:serine/arginine repetitive matrix protein 1-like n=1 Tax=Camellia sinensis TaxID=4442 RepID=UPI0010359F49|nr:serine/arginine repetitive matrix protein 1-like [Camellia sinensis]